jgi:hypothetical protein
MPMNNRLLVPRASGFSPRNISDLALWFDPGDLTTLSQTSDGNTPVTSNNDPVAYIRCKVSGFLLTQTTDANRPLWLADGGSGRPALSFDGGNDVLFNNTAYSPIGTMFVVCGQSASDTVAFSLCQATPSLVSMAVVSRRTSGGVGAGAVSRDGSFSQATRIVTATRYIIAPTFSGGTSLSSRVNGTSGVAASEAIQGNASHVSIGATNTNGTYGRLWNSTVSLALFYSRVLGASEIARLESWASARYGVPLV